MSKFVINNISLYNYSATNDKLSGTIKFTHTGSSMELSVKMEPEDVGRIFEIFAERIAKTMGMAAQSVLEDVAPQVQIPSYINADDATTASADDNGTTDPSGGAHDEPKPAAFDDGIPF